MFTIPMVRILINSGVNMADLPSMPRAMAELVASAVGSVYPVFCPIGGRAGGLHRRLQHGLEPDDGAVPV